jgi:hypothetical protein
MAGIQVGCARFRPMTNRRASMPNTATSGLPGVRKSSPEQVSAVAERDRIKEALRFVRRGRPPGLYLRPSGDGYRAQAPASLSWRSIATPPQIHGFSAHCENHTERSDDGTQSRGGRSWFRFLLAGGLTGHGALHGGRHVVGRRDELLVQHMV